MEAEITERPETQVQHVANPMPSCHEVGLCCSSCLLKAVARTCISQLRERYATSLGRIICQESRGEVSSCHSTSMHI